MQIKLSGTDYQNRIKAFLAKEEVKAYTMAVLSLFAVSFFTLFAIKPTLVTFFSLTRQIEDYQQLDQKLEDKINMLLKAQEEYQKHKNSLALVEQAVPPDAQFTALIKKMEGLSEEHETSLDSLKVEGFDFIASKEGEGEEKSKTEAEGPLSFNFLFIVSGDFDKTESFIKKLMNVKRIVALKNLKMSATKDSDRAISLDSQAKAFYLKNE